MKLISESRWWRAGGPGLSGIALLMVVAAGCRPDGVEPATARIAPAAAPAELPGYNVLLVTLDTTRADRLGAYGYDKARTPALDRIAASGSLFERAYTSCPLTLPAHATLLTGLEPPEHGLRINGGARLGERVPTLATILRSEGYRTGAFVAAFVLNRKFGLDRGFQVYDDDLTTAHAQDIPEPFSVHRDGSVVVDSALKWLEGTTSAPGNPDQPPNTRRQAPFFAWVHLYDPHFPYFAHPALAGTPFEGKESYDGDIAFMDLQVQRLLDFLEQRQLLDRTLVVAVADHGEGLQDHSEFEHGYLLNEEVLHIPLIISLPGVVRAGTRSDAVVSMVDLFPTIVDILGLSDVRQGHGRSLRQALAGQPIESVPSYAETDMPFTTYGWSPLRSLTTPDWKYIRTTRPELYARAADTREIFNLASARPQQLADLDGQLTLFEKQLTPGKTTERVVLAAKDRERMEALGYSSHDQTGTPPGTQPTSGNEQPATTAGSQPPAPLKDIKDMLGTKSLDTTLFRGIVTGTLSPKTQIEMAQELVKRSPETAAFHGRLGAAYLNAGKPEDALAPLTQALTLNGDNVDLRINLGRALARSGKPHEAIPHFRQALVLEPESVDAHVGLANALSEDGELDTASGHYAEVIRLQPENVEAHFNLGNTLSLRRKSDLAIAQYREAVRLRPRFASAHFNLANLLAADGQVDAAIAAYRTTIELEPRNVDAINNLGVALARQDKHAEAKARYAEAVQLRPDFARAHFNLGRELAAERKYAEAIAAYGRAVQLWPAAPDFAAAYARLLATCDDAKLRNPARAVELAEKAMENAKQADAYLLDTLSLAYAAAGRQSEADATAERALRLAELDRIENLAAELKERLGRQAPAAAPGRLAAKVNRHQ